MEILFPLCFCKGFADAGSEISDNNDRYTKDKEGGKMSKEKSMSHKGLKLRRAKQNTDLEQCSFCSCKRYGPCGCTRAKQYRAECASHEKTETV